MSPRPADPCSELTPLRRNLRRVGLAGAWLSLASIALAVTPVSVPRFTHPGAGQTFYIVMPDRFANGRADNDAGHLAGGPEVNGFDPTRTGYYHGGDFVGLTAKLDYIKALGTTAIWTTPPFRNNPVQAGSAGYHGYWITDFLNVDPHLGTNDEYREFIRQAHVRGLRVYLDIVVNHTADIIYNEGGKLPYRDTTSAPWRDAQGQPFDARAVAYNGLNDPAAFPALSATRSFPYVPLLPKGREQIKHPAWLNDVTLYHNRGDSTFRDESSIHGDFSGLDGIFTEHPRVVQGFIDLFGQWLDWGVDGFRIDTMRHVNAAFWQAFAPALRAKARALGRPDFLQFGEVANETEDVALLSEFSTGTMPNDATTDFPFWIAARKFISQGGSASALTNFFQQDDLYTDHDSNAHTNVTLLGNYDVGRWGYFLQQDNPGATPAQLAELAKLGHGLLYLSRGMPVLHYGDEQGMIGRGGWDQQAREDMFASRTPAYATAPLLATTRTGADDKFDPSHPFYRLFSRLGGLRATVAALRTGAMILRPTAEPGLFAFSRIDRGELVEYVAVFNNSRTAILTASVPTSQPAGATIALLGDSRTPDTAPSETQTVDANGALRVTVEPLQFAIWRATVPLPAPAKPGKISLVTPTDGATLEFKSREVDGHIFPTRREIRAEVTGGDGVAEVTFAMTRKSRPGQHELLGTDDAPPYRIFWQPPADLAPGEELEFVATVNDLRGRREAARVGGITVAPTTVAFSIRGAKNPRIVKPALARVDVAAGSALTLAVQAEGTGPFEYQWLRDSENVRDATDATYTVPSAGIAQAGVYRVLVHNLAGTTISSATTVNVTGGGALVKHRSLPSKFVVPREIDVWLPPGYESAPNERFPVIYMHDGQNIFEATSAFGGAAWEVDRAMLRLIAAGKTKGAIVVGVWNTGMGRYGEYMPQKAIHAGSVPMNVGNHSIPSSVIRSDAYLRFLTEELKPFIDGAYRTQPDRSHTSVMGSSMGGLISAYALAEYPNVFGRAACVSTHWPAGDGAVIDYLAQHLPKPGANQLYFDFGTATLDALYEPFQQRMDAVMRGAGYTEGRDWVTRKFPGAEHSEKSWRERVEIPLQFLLAP